MFINRSYWPDAEATGQLLTELAEDLSQKFETVVLNGQPNANPNNEVFRQSGLQIRNGVQIQRVRHTSFSKSSSVGRMLNLITFFLAATFRALFIKRVDIIIVETDPFLMALALPLLKLRHRCRTVVYLQDVYPDVAVQLGVVRNGAMIRLLRHLLFSIYRRVDRVVVLSKDMRQLCVTHGVQDSRISILPNWMDTGKIRPVKQQNPFRAEHHLEDKFVIMHSGNLGMGQRLKPVIELAERLRTNSQYVFLFVGEGARKSELQKQVEERQLTNVSFMTYQPREQLSESLSAADLHVIAMEPAIYQCLMPSKLYGVLATGTSALAIAPLESELSQVVRENLVGITSEGNDINELEASVKMLAEDRELRRQQGSRARQLCVQEYDRKVVTRQFGELLEDTLGISKMQEHKARNNSQEHLVCRAEGQVPEPEVSRT